MNLYEINQALLNACSFNINPETGEVLEDIDFALIESLELERDAKIEQLCLWHKNLLAEHDMFKSESAKLAKQAKLAQNKAERIKQQIEYTLNGEKFQKGVVKVSYTTSTKVDVQEIEALDEVYFLAQPPTINKRKLTQDLKDGIEIAGAKLVKATDMHIK